MQEPVHLSTADQLGAALVLTIVGGFVDAIGWITLLEVFTANMSGNSIHFGMAFGQLDFGDLRRFACSIGAYVLGLIITRIGLEMAGRAGVRRMASVTLTLEAVLLLAFRFIAPPLQQGRIADQGSLVYFGMIAMLAFAMGVQTATLTHLGPLTVYTTFVTGTLTKFAESFARTVFWIHDAIKAGSSFGALVGGLRSQKDAMECAFLLGIWICYVAGAAVGTASKAVWELHALYAPVAVLAGLVLLDLMRPIAGKEVEEQAAG